MELSRRSFIKLGGAAICSLGVLGIAGCASDGGVSQNASAANSFNEDVEPAVDNATTHTDTTDQNVGGANSGVAVVYFSCTGNTKAVAEKIAEATSGSLMEIIPAEQYTQADLDYNTSGSRAEQEQKEVTSRPGLAEPVPDLYRYETVYIGYPIWWDAAPRPVLTFIEGANLADKEIIPFCTSVSSGIDASLTELESAAPDAEWETDDAKRFSASATQEEVNDWIDSITDDGQR